MNERCLARLDEIDKEAERARLKIIKLYNGAEEFTHSNYCILLDALDIIKEVTAGMHEVFKNE